MNRITTTTVGIAAVATLIASMVACTGPAAPGGGGGGGAASQSLEEQLPDEVNGVELAVEVESSETAGESGLSVDDEFLEAVEGAGGSRENVEIGFAHDPSGEFAASVLAVRAPGVNTAEFQAAFLARVEDDAGGDFTESTVGGKQVFVGEAEDVGTAYVYFRGDTVFQVFGDEEAAAAMLDALP